MGFVEKVKNVISKLRAAGKTEKEVSEIIEQAAEAATVLKKTESPEHPEKIKAAGGEIRPQRRTHQKHHSSRWNLNSKK